MEHGDRIKVVRGIHIRTQNKYKNQILFGGVYGSTALGRDTEFSDIEMMYVMKGDQPSETKTFLYRGLPIEINLISLEEVNQQIETLTILTPVHTGNLRNLQLLIGELKDRELILEKYENLPQAKIEQFFAEHGSEIAFESLNKLRSLTRRAGKAGRELYIFEVVQEIALSLALVNRETVTRGYYPGIKESYTYQKVPDHYKDLMESFMKAEELALAVETGQQLLASYQHFLASQGILIPDFKTLDEVVW